MACWRCRLSPHKEAAAGVHESECECSFACPCFFFFWFFFTHSQGLSFFRLPRRAVRTPQYFGYGPIHFLHARRQRTKPGAWLSKALPHACKIPQCYDGVRRGHAVRWERRQRVQCLRNKLLDWSATKSLFYTKHYGNRACSITHYPCHGPFEARSPGAHGRRWHKATPYGILCGGLQYSAGELHCESMGLSIGLINVSVIQEVFFMTATLHLCQATKTSKKPSYFTCTTDGGSWSWL